METKLCERKHQLVDRCALCHDVIKSEGYKLSCEHFFHTSCLNKHVQENSTCPVRLCNSRVPTEKKTVNKFSCRCPSPFLRDNILLFALWGFSLSWFIVGWVHHYRTFGSYNYPPAAGVFYCGLYVGWLTFHIIDLIGRCRDSESVYGSGTRVAILISLICQTLTVFAYFIVFQTGHDNWEHIFLIITFSVPSVVIVVLCVCKLSKICIRKTTVETVNVNGEICHI